jgi:hypothetical protein
MTLPKPTYNPQGALLWLTPIKFRSGGALWLWAQAARQVGAEEADEGDDGEEGEGGLGGGAELAAEDVGQREQLHVVERLGEEDAHQHQRPRDAEGKREAVL